MERITHRATERGDAAFSAAGSFERYIERIPAAFALTRGDQHTLVYANAAFRRLGASDGQALIGRPITDVFALRDTSSLTAVLDRAFRTGVVSRDLNIEAVNERAL